MKRKTGTILAALLVIAGGILLILHATNVIRISLFPGWWTLFIIIPTLISMLNTRVNAGHLICLSVGIILLLRANGILTGINLWLLLLGLVVVCVGISLLWRRPAPGREPVSPTQQAGTLSRRASCGTAGRKGALSVTATMTSSTGRSS